MCLRLGPSCGLWSGPLARGRLASSVSPILAPVADVFAPIASIFTPVDPVFEPIAHAGLPPRVADILTAIAHVFPPIAAIFAPVADIFQPVPPILGTWPLPRGRSRRRQQCEDQSRDGECVNPTHVRTPSQALLLRRDRPRQGCLNGVNVERSAVATENDLNDPNDSNHPNGSNDSNDSQSSFDPAEYHWRARTFTSDLRVRISSDRRPAARAGSIANKY